MHGPIGRRNCTRCNEVWWRASYILRMNDDDWSAGSWELCAQTRLVRQRARDDCGIACLAMVAGVTYERAADVFAALNIGRRGTRRSNYAGLVLATHALGLHGHRRPWRGWATVEGVAILKIPHPKGQNWHWVVAERTTRVGVIVRDPDLPLVGFHTAGSPEHASGDGASDIPLDVLHQDASRYTPSGTVLLITRSEAAPAIADTGVPYTAAPAIKPVDAAKARAS